MKITALPSDHINRRPAMTKSWTIQVTISHQAELEARLNDAVGRAMEEARGSYPAGILVTRNTPRTYTVELSEAVPYGTIHERTMH